MTSLGTPRQLTGPPDRVRQTLARLNDAGVVEAFSPPEPHPHGCVVRVWIRQSAPQARRLEPVRQPAGHRPLTPEERRVAISLAVGGGVLFLLFAVGWLIVRAISGAASWVAGNPFVAVLALIVVVGSGGLWLTRKGKRGGGNGNCPGLVHHCSRCPDHR